MSARRVALLVVAALLVIAGALYLSSQRELPQATLAGDAVLPGLLAQVGAISEIRLSRGDGTVVTLRREASGWSVVERGYPADVGRIRKLLLDLGALSVLEEKTHAAANYAALGVDDPKTPEARGTLVAIRTPTGTRSLIVGKPSGSNASFVRLAGAPASALARPQINAETQPTTWLDLQLLDVATERQESLLRVQGKGKAVPVNEPGVKAQLMGLTFDDVRATTPGLAGERLLVQTKDGLSLELAGKRDGERRFVVLTARSSATAKPDVIAEAQRLAARGAGREFELPIYRYEAIFPLR